MSRFIETIAVQDGHIRRLELHQQRVDRTLNAFASGATLDLHAAIQAQHNHLSGLVKCRVVYDGVRHDLTFSPYIPRRADSLRVVVNNDIDYSFKYEDRSAIDRAFSMRGGCDDIVIVRNGLITDTSVANIVFRKDGKWFTPRQPLLEGTMRQHCMDAGTVSARDISVNDLSSFDGFKLINAMMDFDAKELPVSNILF